MTASLAVDNPILAEHAAEIRRLGQRAVMDLVEIGRRLAESRQLLKEEGCWRSWLKDELRWSPQTAGRFIQIYELSGDVPNLERLELPISALYMLAAPSTPPAARAEILQRAAAGERVTVTEVKAIVAKAKPEPKPKLERGVNPACLTLFENEDQVDAFVDAVTTPAAKRFISVDQQLVLARHFAEAFKAGRVRRNCVPYIKAYVSGFVRDASKAQGKIDAEETEDFYKQSPGHEIRDEVAAVESLARSLIASLLKLEQLFKRFPHHPFFGNIGGKLDLIIGMIRQFRRTAGENSADEDERKLERKLARMQELEQKTRAQEITITGLRSEIEELREKLADRERAR
jgi:DUF3102 family protein